MDHRLLTISVAALSIFMVDNILAYEAYNLHDDLWAVECKDGKLETYTGDERGLEMQGIKLCKNNGGLLGESTDLVVKSFNNESDSSDHETSVIVRGLEDDSFEEIPSEIYEPFDTEAMNAEEVRINEK